MQVLLVQGNPTEKFDRTTALEDAGYVVDSAVDANEAFECLDIYEYDVVVLDRLPPKLDGCVIIRRMRARRIDTPVVVLTAWLSDGMAVTALRAGADDVVTHPIGSEELVARIEAIMRRRGGHAQSALQVGSMVIDMSTHEVIVAGRPMHLSNKEFGVLQLLALRRGTVVTKVNALNSLYNGRDDPQSRTIEVFVCCLRKKMAAIGANVTIDTVHGVGYILRAETLGETDPALGRSMRRPTPAVVAGRPVAEMAA